jgi:tetratricopeptide (TPR) repeat protein
VERASGHELSGPTAPLGPPGYVAINPALARIGADSRIPQHWGRHAVWHPDGNRLIYADSRNSRIWQFNVATQKNEAFADLASASYVAVSSDAKWIAGASWPIEQVRVWNAATQKCVLEVPESGRMSFGPDGRILAVSSRSGFRFYSTRTWKTIRSWQSDTLNTFHAAPIAFQPAGRIFAAAVSAECVRLFETDSGEVIADLPMREDADINWLSFSPDGAPLAITRAERDVLIWNLHSLRNELDAIGLPVPSLPGTEQIIENRHVSKLDRGRDLPSPNSWWSSHELLARIEAIKLNFPDAIDRLDIALNLATPLDPVTRARLLFQRGEYHLLNNDSIAARADFRNAVRLNPCQPENLRRLIELLLFGPFEIRDSDAARLLLQDLVSQNESSVQDRLNLTLTYIHGNRLRAARDLFEQITHTTILESDAVTQTAYHSLRICIQRGLTEPENMPNLSDDPLSIVETRALGDRARESASAIQSAAIERYCELIEP